MSPRSQRGSRKRYIDTTLELIAEEGGSQSVNLRAISRRMGCAHTNAYNYFDSLGDLRWAAFARGLRVYGEFLIRDLDRGLTPAEFLRRVVFNLASFPLESPGIYRFIASDPIDLETIPDEILRTVIGMKRWFVTVVESAASPAADPARVREAAEIVLAYIDGETLNLINGRVIPDEDLRSRIVPNAMRLFELLAGGTGAGLRDPARQLSPPPEPALIFEA